MTNQQNEKTDANIGDVLGSMMGFARASSQFTFRQMQNAMGLCVGSQSALNSVRDSIDSVAHAMSERAEEAERVAKSSEPEPAETVFTGRKI